jgi:hypothetical protein
VREDYPIFNHWYQTLDWILSTIEKFPKNARFSIASRLSDLALDTVENTIEAIYVPQIRKQALRKINLDLEKQRVFYRLAHDRQYISTRQYQHISKSIDEMGKMVGGWVKSDAKAV